MNYVPQGDQKIVQGYVDNYRRAREILEEVSELTRERLRRTERL